MTLGCKMQYEALITVSAVEVKRSVGDTKYMFAMRYKAAQKSKLSEDTYYVEATSGFEERSLGSIYATRCMERMCHRNNTNEENKERDVNNVY